jgi:CBS domain containing-hemolysin-like protein
MARRPWGSHFEITQENSMTGAYLPLEPHRLHSNTTYHQPVLPQPRRVTQEDAAIEVMTDFRTVRAITVPASVSIQYAQQRMRSNRIHLLLITDDRNVILGLITSTDIEGEKPLQQIHKRGVRRDEIMVSDIMTPRERLEAVLMDDVLRALVGDIVATLEAVGRRHALVIDYSESGGQLVRGLFAVSQLNRQLGTTIEPQETARSFAEVEAILAHT